MAWEEHAAMAYELRVNGTIREFYNHPEDALDRVRALMKSDCDIEPEVLDTRTGRAFEPAASIRWREELANKIGY
jgi:hypothetical protein